MPHRYWSGNIKNLYRQVDPGQPGHVLLISTGADSDQLSYFDRLMFDACQVTNPPIDPLREPMELKTFLGRREYSSGSGRAGVQSERRPGFFWAGGSVRSLRRTSRLVILNEDRLSSRAR